MSKVNLNKCSVEELFIAARKITNELAHKVVKNERRKPTPVMAIFNSAWSYIPQENDKFRTDSDGNPSIKKWPIEHLVHNKASWEAMGNRKASEYHNHLPKDWCRDFSTNYYERNYY